jgi:release factor glutamine methyltransferase
LTLIEVLRRATGYLDQHGSDSPRLDAELLLAHSLGLRRLDLYLQFERPLSETELEPYRDLVARRGKGEPVAYLVGRKEFMGLEFEVTADVLVPNPDTEVLVQLAVSWGRERGSAGRYADVGTGSGCIAVAVAHFLEGAEVFASDASPAALQVARRNVARHDLEGRVHLAQGDLLEPAPDGLDAVCANLPYLDCATDLPAEVLAQPREALFAGDRLVRRLLEEAPAKLKAGGAVFAEIDPGLAGSTLELARRLYSGATVHKDLGGRDRVLQAWDPRPWTS